MVRRIRVITDKTEYQKQLSSSGPNRYREVPDQELKELPNDAYILTGEKTKAFGGGPSPDGFVISRGNLLGRLRIEGRLIREGTLTI